MTDDRPRRTTAVVDASIEVVRDAFRGQGDGALEESVHVVLDELAHLRGDLAALTTFVHEALARMEREATAQGAERERHTQGERHGEALEAKVARRELLNVRQVLARAAEWQAAGKTMRALEELRADLPTPPTLPGVPGGASSALACCGRLDCPHQDPPPRFFEGQAVAVFVRTGPDWVFSRNATVRDVTERGVRITGSDDFYPADGVHTLSKIEPHAPP